MEEGSKNIKDKESGFTIIRNFDPDSDGFKFEIDEAISLHKNMNILQFVRRKLLQNKCKEFDQQSKGLSEFLAAEFQPKEEARIVINLDGPEAGQEEIMQPDQPELKVPQNWECKKHDKSLLKAANEKGLEFFSQLSNNNDYGFKDIAPISKEFALKRIEKICEYFRDIQSQVKIPKKTKYSYDPMILKQGVAKEPEPGVSSDG